MYLGVDLGDKRVGIAVYIEGIIVPKGIVPRINLIKILKNLVREYNVKVIVVGLPYDLYNKDTKQLEKTLQFVNKLKDIFRELEIIGIDERYTSYEASEVLKLKGDKNALKDDISASIILESYLKNKNIY